MNKKVMLFAFLFFGIWLTYGQMTINGNVADADGFASLDATVTVEGTLNETVTDESGNYSLTVNLEDAVDGNVNLVISDGITTINEKVPYQEGQTVTLFTELSDTVELEEAVAIGFGTAKKEDLTGAVALITEEDFNQGNIVTADNLLQGRSPGVVITNPGTPGASGVIRIRGGSSLNASNDPLIVIDGLQLTDQEAGGARSVLGSLNPNDIESFSILKDASATAIYGARGSNGVIIITTKKGGKKFKVNYSMNMGFQTVNDRVDVFSGDAYRQLIADRQAAGQANITQGVLDLIGTANTDWQDEILRDVVSTNHNLTITGSPWGVLPARFSAGYNVQPGTIITSSYERANLSLALNPSFFDKHLQINFNGNYAFEDNTFADDAPGKVRSAITYNPTVPVRDASNGTFGNYFQYTTIEDGFTRRSANAPGNPVANLLQENRTGNSERVFGSVEADYKLHFFPDVRVKLFAGLDRTWADGVTIQDNNFFVDAARDDDGNITGSIDPTRIENSNFTSYRNSETYRASLVYTKQLNDWNIDFTGIYDYQKFEFEDFASNNLNDPQSAEPDIETDIDRVIISLAGRLNLGYLDKYLLTVNFNRNASSAFGQENRWGNFPGVAFAWKMHKENFLSGFNALSQLKLRLGWGITGSQASDTNVQSAIYQSVLAQSNQTGRYIFGSTPLIIRQSLGQNVDIQWEETEQYNIGLDYGFFNDRLNGSLDLYLKNTSDLIFDAPVADGVNFTNQLLQNVGELETKGLEFIVNYDVIRSSKIDWNVSYNFALNSREVTSLPSGDIVTGGGIGAQPNTILREGESPFAFYSFQQIYDANGAPIQGAFVDFNGDGVINSSDQYVSGKPDPDFTMGFSSNLSGYGFDLYFNLRAQVGGDVINQLNAANSYYSQLAVSGFPANIPTSVFDNNFVGPSDNQLVNSDIFVEDASFLRMDNITLGYTFKDPFKNSTSKVRLWAGVQNVFVITDYSGLDPEISEVDEGTGRVTGIDNAIYPRPRTFMLGANITF